MIRVGIFEKYGLSVLLLVVRRLGLLNVLLPRTEKAALSVVVPEGLDSEEICSFSWLLLWLAFWKLIMVKIAVMSGRLWG